MRVPLNGELSELRPAMRATDMRTQSTRWAESVVTGDEPPPIQFRRRSSKGKGVIDMQCGKCGVMFTGVHDCPGPQMSPRREPGDGGGGEGRVEEECGKPCAPESGCPECASYWHRMRVEGYWINVRGWTAKAIHEMCK